MDAVSFHCIFRKPILAPLFGVLFMAQASVLHAQPVDLSDVPLGTEANVPPNIMMTVDDSGSMSWYYTPDDIGSVPNACWGALNSIANCGYPGGTPSLHPPLMAAAFNRLAYDPLVTYAPPMRADGTSLPEMTNWASVGWPNPFVGAPTPANLTQRFPAYSAAQGTVLFQKYMINADPAVQTMFTTTYNRQLPPHYYKTSVKWCSSLRTTGVLAGSADPSNCQNDRNAIFRFPYYYSPFGDQTSPRRDDNTQFPAFELVVLDVNNPAPSYTHLFFNEETGAMDQITRTFAQEMTNYANWYAYYRNRAAATKAAASQAFQLIPDSPGSARTGFSTINRNILQRPAALTGTQRTNFFSNILTSQVSGGTPLRTALNTVGNMFAERGSNAPINSNMACQRNYVIMFTDGLWNGGGPNVGNVDNTLTSSLPANVSVYGSSGLSPGNPWPLPIRDTRNASDTLADIALSFWMRDLRPDLPNTVLSTNKDPATWQHLNFVGMGFGVQGTLPSSDQAATIAAIRAGTLSWPAPQNDQTTTVDDLWHASINGFGRFVSAASPAEFSAGLRSILNEILNVGGARGGAGVSTRNLRSGAQSFAYMADFSPGWNGDLLKKRINPDGTEGAVVWRASDTLAAALTATTTMPNPWDTNRYVFTRIEGEYAPTYAVPFRFENLTSTQLATFGVTPTRQRNVIAYLRGDRSREGDTIGRFRVRGGFLGDVVNASPAVVMPPPEKLYDEAENPGYTVFSASQSNRGTFIYVPANDGMLHAFDDNGRERWAYVPMDILRPQADGGLVNLTNQEGHITTPFQHKYYVDASPRVTNVKIGGDWRTLLVGGLGKGGTSYYALDVTSPIASSEENAATRSLWEFTDDNMGYTHGRALLAKTRAWGGKWIAILPSGLNNGSGAGQPKNGDGRGRIFFVDLATGEKLHEIVTNAGSTGTPSGLMHIAGYTEVSSNQLATAVYGGDQLGNFWRFNMESTNPSDWKVERLAVLKDKHGRPQVVSTEPWVALGSSGNRWVIVGTGRLINREDLTATTEHAMYALRDGDKENASTNVDISRGDLALISEDNSGPSKVTPTDKGWYEEMDALYNVNVNPRVAYGYAFYAANRFWDNSSGTLWGDLCRNAAFTGMAYVRSLEDAELGLQYTGDGITGITTMLIDGPNGDPELVPVFSTVDGKLVRPPNRLPFAPGGGTASDVPGRTSIRYID